MIASNVGGIPEIVEGTETRLVPAGDAVALAIETVLGDPTAAQARAPQLKARVGSHFTVCHYVRPDPGILRCPPHWRPDRSGLEGAVRHARPAVVVGRNRERPDGYVAPADNLADERGRRRFRVSRLEGDAAHQRLDADPC